VLADTLVAEVAVEVMAAVVVAGIIIHPIPSQLLALLHLEEPQVILQIQQEAQLETEDTAYTHQDLVTQVAGLSLLSVPTENSQ
jgi:hypothetical protein